MANLDVSKEVMTRLYSRRPPTEMLAGERLTKVIIKTHALVNARASLARLRSAVQRVADEGLQGETLKLNSP
eukprot:scaffold650139_cov36-Prasinocladus_malaysianus.AAC.1